MPTSSTKTTSLPQLPCILSGMHESECVGYATASAKPRLYDEGDQCTIKLFWDNVSHPGMQWFIGEILQWCKIQGEVSDNGCNFLVCQLSKWAMDGVIYKGQMIIVW
ncbi:hypothetical protein P691DRAFT_783421 [Macrolepiota fuliginosa MF-IS2]|uniref:Uncharacterized protein n=1 Tax=Macrolepiota fuliginosa MF-IS2 TaxID=1400762 RepID=A0A9P5WZC6_9AGAR|nr:hypothetical protein P691DRAFT_783421 [Macrolepiota fuliginosa MF-IS2]